MVWQIESTRVSADLVCSRLQCHALWLPLRLHCCTPQHSCCTLSPQRCAALQTAPRSSPARLAHTNCTHACISVEGWKPARLSPHSHVRHWMLGGGSPLPPATHLSTYHRSQSRRTPCPLISDTAHDVRMGGPRTSVSWPMTPWHCRMPSLINVLMVV